MGKILLIIYPCRLQNCHLFLTDSLTKTWKDYLSEERSVQKMDFTQKDMTTLKKGAGLVATVASKVRRRKETTSQQRRSGACESHDTVT